MYTISFHFIGMCICICIHFFACSQVNSFWTELFQVVRHIMSCCPTAVSLKLSFDAITDMMIVAPIRRLGDTLQHLHLGSDTSWNYGVSGRGMCHILQKLPRLKSFRSTSAIQRYDNNAFNDDAAKGMYDVDSHHDVGRVV
jgi:hypothetical protein